MTKIKPQNTFAAATERDMAADPTNHRLEYALLDQKVAGAFHGKEYAYVAIMRAAGKPWGVGIAVEDESGFSPVNGPNLEWDNSAAADVFCVGMNRHIGLHPHRATEIIASSMKRIIASSMKR